MILQSAVMEPFVAKMFVLISQAGYSDGIPDAAKELLKLDDTYNQYEAIMKRGQEEGTIREGNTKALNPNTPCPESDWIVDIIRRK